jgi:DNA-binding HxlR family transcriptional regulator
MKPTAITANNLHGRVLIALRAGRMTSSQLRERIPGFYQTLPELESNGLIEKDDPFYQITDAGRAACPNRRGAALEPMYARKSATVQQGATA